MLNNFCDIDFLIFLVKKEFFLALWKFILLLGHLYLDLSEQLAHNAEVSLIDFVL